MRLKNYINEVSFPSWILRLFDKVKNELKKIPFSEFEDKCRKSFDEVSKHISEDDLKKLKQKYNLYENVSVINEDVKHWWDLIKSEAFPTLAFYPALQVWLEFDKMLKGTPYSGKIIGFYAAFWLLLVSGKYIAGWMKWKKENPEEYEKERGGRDVIRKPRLEKPNQRPKPTPNPTIRYNHIKPYAD